MPVVDLDSETGKKKIQEERAAICGFMVVLVLNQMILMLEEDPAEKMDLQKRIKHFLGVHSHERACPVSGRFQMRSTAMEGYV